MCLVNYRCSSLYKWYNRIYRINHTSHDETYSRIRSSNPNTLLRINGRYSFNFMRYIGTYHYESFGDSSWNIDCTSRKSTFHLFIALQKELLTQTGGVYQKIFCSDFHNYSFMDFRLLCKCLKPLSAYLFNPE